MTTGERFSALLPAGRPFAGYGPGFRQSLIRFAPINNVPSAVNQRSSCEYRVDHWQTEDGLPGDEGLLCVVADSRWLSLDWHFGWVGAI